MKVLKNSAIYLVANFLTKGISVLLIPVLTKYLAPESYGYVLLFSALLVFFNPLLYCGSVDMIAIDYFKGKETFSRTLQKSTTSVIYATGLTTLLFILLSPFLTRVFELPYWAIVILPLTGLLSYALELLLLLLRYKGKHISYLTATSFKTAVEVGVSLAGLVLLNWGWFSRVLGMIAGFAVAAVFLVRLIPYGTLVGNLSIYDFKAVMKRGAPFIVAQFLLIAFASVDKLFIPHFFTRHELGLYGIAFQISSLLTVFSASFASVLQPIQYKLGANLTEENKLKIIEIIFLYTGVLLACAFVLLLIAPLGYRFFIHAQYRESLAWVPYLVLAGFLSGCSAFLINIIRQKGTGKQLIAVNFYPLLVLIVLLFFLPKYYSIYGVIYAYIFVNIFILLLALYRVKKVLGASRTLFLIQFKRIFNIKVNEVT